MLKKLIIILFMLIPGAAVFSDSPLDLRIVPGEHWIGEGRVFLFVKIEVEPTFAVWLEDAEGRFIETLYVTGKAASSDWNATKGRPDALPIWGRRALEPQENGLFLPSKENPLPDSMTSATPMADTIIPLNPVSDLEPGKYKVYLELNIAFDYNEYWKRKLPKRDPAYSGDNGQPSILWEAELNLGDDKKETVMLTPVGMGSPLGTDGLVHQMKGINTALEIARTINVTEK